MTVTELHRPPVSVADRLHTAARFVESLGDPTSDVFYISLGAARASIQIVHDLPLAERQRWLYTAAAVLAVQVIRTVPFGNAGRAAHWGNLAVDGTYRGLPVHVYTGLSLVEARELGLAICAGCAHTDHEGDTCLVAGFDTEGVERACECGRPDAEQVLVSGGVMSAFDVAAAQAIELVNGRRHEERCEQADDDLRDAAAEERG